MCRRSGCRSRAERAASRIPRRGPRRSGRRKLPNRGCPGRPPWCWRVCCRIRPTSRARRRSGRHVFECTSFVESHAASTTSATRASESRVGRMAARYEGTPRLSRPRGPTRRAVADLALTGSGRQRRLFTRRDALPCHPDPRTFRLRVLNHSVADVNSLGIRTCPGGEIGRHGGLKPPCPKGRVGSNPTPGTRKSQVSASTARLWADDASCRLHDSCTDFFGLAEIGRSGLRRPAAVAPATIDAGTLDDVRTHFERAVNLRAGGDGDPVFAARGGGLMHPDSFSNTFDRLVATAGVPRIRLHDLRHTYATLALGAGMHPVVLAERLGHSSVATTMDLYAHVTPAISRDGADIVANTLFGPHA